MSWHSRGQREFQPLLSIQSPGSGDPTELSLDSDSESRRHDILLLVVLLIGPPLDEPGKRRNAGLFHVVCH